MVKVYDIIIIIMLYIHILLYRQKLNKIHFIYKIALIFEHLTSNYTEKYYICY